MAEPKTSTYFIRLTKDFPVGQVHRRAGIALAAGPDPVEVELTDAQIALIKADRFFQVIPNKEAKKILGAKEAAAPVELEHPDATPPVNGRVYDTGANGGTLASELPGNEDLEEDETTPPINQPNGSGDTQGDGSGQSPEGEGDEEVTKLSTDMKLVELQAIATERGVADADKMRSKQAVLDAIEAHEANSGE